MIIFYTVKIKNNFKTIEDAPFCFFQTLLSAYSIRKAKWEDLIIIYTNAEEKFKKTLFKYDNIEYRQMPDEYKKWAGGYFEDYCHSRCFLAFDLLEEFKQPVLYLDPDTGIKNNCGIKERKKFLQQKNPVFYRPEIYNNFSFWCIPKTIENIWPTFKKDMGIPGRACVINNGVLFFPYNRKGLVSAREMRETYNKLRKELEIRLEKASLSNEHLMFCDMFTASVVYYKKKCKVFYGEEFHNIRGQGENDSQVPIIHYYNAKYNNHSLWRKAMEEMKKEFKFSVF